MPKALFVTYGGGHVTMVIPVAKELQGRKGWEVQALGLTMARARLEAAGVETFGFKDFILPEDRMALIKGAELAATDHTEGLGITREESTAYLGLCYVDLERQFGADETARRYGELGRKAFLPLGPLQRILTRLRPDVVIATDSPRSEQAAIVQARRNGIPAVCMVSLFGLDWGSPFLRDPGFADQVTVMSDWVRDYLVSLGRGPEQIVVTGNSAFERLGDPSLPGRGEALRSEKGWTRRKVVLWASQIQPAMELPPLIMSELHAAVDRHPDWQIVYRPHPNEPPLPLPIHPRISFSGRGDDLSALLFAVDVTIVISTTVGMEAALAGRPLIKVCCSPFNYAAPYEKMDLALPVERIEDLERCLAMALSDTPESRRMAEARKRLPPIKGASGRVADVIESLIRR